MKMKIIMKALVGLGILILIMTIFLVAYATTNQRKLDTTINLLTEENKDIWSLYNSTAKLLNTTSTNYANLQNSYDQELKNREQDDFYEFFATGYTIDDPSQGTTNINACGWDLHDERFSSLPQIAADFNILPKYTIVEILGMGIYIVSDSGSKIKGFKVDILCPDKETALSIYRTVYIRILTKGITIHE